MSATRASACAPRPDGSGFMATPWTPAQPGAPPRRRGGRPGRRRPAAARLPGAALRAPLPRLRLRVHQRGHPRPRLFPGPPAAEKRAHARSALVLLPRPELQGPPVLAPGRRGLPGRLGRLLPRCRGPGPCACPWPSSAGPDKIAFVDEPLYAYRVHEQCNFRVLRTEVGQQLAHPFPAMLRRQTRFFDFTEDSARAGQAPAVRGRAALPGQVPPAFRVPPAPTTSGPGSRTPGGPTTTCGSRTGSSWRA